MKTSKSVWLLTAILSVLFFSCRKADVTPNDLAVASSSNCGGGGGGNGGGDDEGGGGGNGGGDGHDGHDGDDGGDDNGDGGGGGNGGGGGGYTPVDTTGLSFCSPVTVSLCTKNGVVIGSLTVQTGSDRNTYVVYSLVGDWYLSTCSVFAGYDNAIPVNNSGVAATNSFPYRTRLNSSTYHSCVIKINGLPSIYTVAANAVAQKVVNNRKVDAQSVWGDGCSGNTITSSNWATKFNYARLNCMVADICSKPLKTYFDSTLNGVQIAWPSTGNITMSLTGNVTVNVAGYSYTEAEGRAIYNTMNGNNPAESRTAFIHIATLKLSGTNYSLDADLQAAVTTIENWLQTKGKLSPTNLPSTSNLAVKNASIFLDRWIKMYTCPDRR